MGQLQLESCGSAPHAPVEPAPLQRLAAEEIDPLLDFELRTFAEKICLQEGRLGCA